MIKPIAIAGVTVSMGLMCYFAVYQVPDLAIAAALAGLCYVVLGVAVDDRAR